MRKKAKVGEIWLALIPEISKIKELNIIIKKRPCLIIDDGHGFIIENSQDYLGMKISSQNNKHNKEIKNWDDLGLKKKSYIRIEVPIKIEEKQLIKKISSINKYDMYIYLNELSDFFNNDIINKFKKVGDENS